MPSGATVLDVGANVGAHVEKLANVVGHSGRVIAFEPLPALVALIRENNKHRPWVEVRALALGATEQDGAPFHYLPAQHWHSGLRPVVPEAASETINVQVTTLDALARSFPRVTFVKIDAEGPEIDPSHGRRCRVHPASPADLCRRMR